LAALPALKRRLRAARVWPALAMGTGVCRFWYEPVASEAPTMTAPKNLSCNSDANDLTLRYVTSGAYEKQLALIPIVERHKAAFMGTATSK
jgi:4-amino-4-deoxy-L-arabinose transferase-like glycosyltransferase